MKPNEQQAQHNNNHIPVIKRPRPKWSIPRVDEGEQLVNEQQEEARLKALAEGTTPLGRELLRHLFWETKRALQCETQTYEEIETATAGVVARERLFQPEWAILIARLLRTDPEKLNGASSLLLGKLITLMASESLRIKPATGVCGRNFVTGRSR
jgi:hypothetical protein